MKNSIFPSMFEGLENSVPHASLERWLQIWEGESSSVLVVSLIILERSIHHKSPACITFCRTGYIFFSSCYGEYLAIWVTLSYCFKGHPFCLIIWVSYLFHYVCCDFPQMICLILNNFWNTSFLPHCMRKLHPHSSSRMGNIICAINCKR